MDDILDLQEVVLSDLNKDIFNFKKLLHPNNSIVWRNCHNLKIIIGSTINKLQFIKCSNITIKIKKTISGMEICKSKNIKIITSPRCPLNYLNIYQSILSLYINKNDESKLTIDYDKKSTIRIINSSEKA
jgi:hypothetical protein